MRAWLCAFGAVDCKMASLSTGKTAWLSLCPFAGNFFMLDLNELNLVYEHQNVDRETESYIGELFSILECHFFVRVVLQEQQQNTG